MDARIRGTCCRYWCRRMRWQRRGRGWVWPGWSPTTASAVAAWILAMCVLSAGGLPVVGGGGRQPSAVVFVQSQASPSAAGDVVITGHDAAAAPPGRRTSDDPLCDVTVWDTTREARGVRSVVTRCAEGRVTWRLPYAGLRVAFLPPAAAFAAAASSDAINDDDAVEICVVVTSSFSVVKVSLDDSAASAGDRADALRKPIAVVDDKLSSSSAADFCFRSSVGDARRQVALYAEAAYSSTALTLGRVTFDYDVRVVVHGARSDPDGMDDCRPCTDEELMLSVCTADFAIEGRMLSVEDDANRWSTTVDVQISGVLRQTSNFLEFLDDTSRQQRRRVDHRRRPPSTETESDGGTAVLRSTEAVSAEAAGAGVEVPVTVPRRCRVRRGDGLFLFVGRVRFGRTLLLRCAPRADQFRALWAQAVRSQTNPCTLD